jgi:hypothetical protein
MMLAGRQPGALVNGADFERQRRAMSADPAAGKLQQLVQQQLQSGAQDQLAQRQQSQSPPRATADVRGTFGSGTSGLQEELARLFADIMRKRTVPPDLPLPYGGARF